uniref:GRIP domain-containing protein n=1 Tax=Globodera pallida TaxID=36090 RepID=A0A183BHT0_GLOPA
MDAVTSGTGEDQLQLEGNGAKDQTVAGPPKDETEGQPREKAQQQQQQSGGSGTALAKLDSLSREDLIKLAKKQLIVLKETRKHLATARKESEEYATQMRELSTKMSADSSSFSSTSEGGGMMAIELADYKSALVAARKELAEGAAKTGEREAMVEELSQRIAQLQLEKEEVNSELRLKNTQNAELTQKMEENGRLLSEHAKEAGALQFRLNEASQSAQDELHTLQNEQQQLQAELAAVRRTADARGAEARRLRVDSERSAQLLAGLKEEFAAYKERAECALAKFKEVAAGGAISGENGGNSSSEFQQLIDALSTRNAQITELNAKCSFLEEELRSGHLHSKTLLDELNSLHDQQQTQRQQWAGERQRIVAEHAERMRAEETIRAELRKELQATRERETAAVALQQMEKVSGHKQQQTAVEELRRECDRLSRELEEAKSLLKSSVPPKVPPSLLQLPSRPYQTTIKHLSKPTPLNFGFQPQQFTTTTTATTNSLEMDAEEEGAGVLGTTHSESSDSMDDLNSVLQEAVDGAVPGGDLLTTFNVASLAEHFGGVRSDECDGSVSANLQQHFVGRDQHQEVLKLLEDCRELLNETEEDNVRLNEQVAVLKTEIRRMERCKKRVEHLGNGLCPEYFKNIVLKFLAPPKVRDERVQLLPVLQSILNLDAAELEQIRRNCIVQATNGTLEGEEVPSETTTSTFVQHKEEDNDGWSSWFGWK